MAFIVWNFQEERISRDARRDEATNPEKQIDEGPPGPLDFSGRIRSSDSMVWNKLFSIRLL